MNTIEKQVCQFHKICKNKYEAHKQFSSQSQKQVFGYFCTYFPAEIVHAAGMLPIRILGDKRKLIYVEAYLPSFGCSFVRTSLELGLSGTLDYLSGVGFSHTCDSIQVLSDVWRDIFKNQFVANIIFPAKLNERHAYSFLVKELELFTKKLETYLGISIKEEQLWASIQIYEKNRELLRQLYQWRREHPGILRGSDVLNIVIASMLIPKEEHNKLLEQLLCTLNDKNVTQGEIEGKALVVLAGNICAFPDIIEVIEDSGALIVDDDLCTGSRYFLNFKNKTKRENESALSYIARTYLSKFPCPAKYDSRNEVEGRSGFSQLRRDDILLSIVENSKADGVIFTLLRLCDAYSYDYTLLKKALDKKGYPSIVIEYEQQTKSFQQIQTRVEAFVETIKEY